MSVILHPYLPDQLAVYPLKGGTFSGLQGHGNHRILPHMGQYSVPSSHNVQSVKKPRMVYFSTLIITGILKKILEHAEVQGFAKASRPCKQIDVSLDFKKLLYKFCFIYKIIISCDQFFKIVNPHGQCFDKHGYTPCILLITYYFLLFAFCL